MQPMCPKCGWRNTRPSLRQGIIDALLRLFFLAPMRCRSCRHRFYRFSTWWAKFIVPLGISALLALGAVELWPTWVTRVWTRATTLHSVPVDSGSADRQLPFR